MGKAETGKEVGMNGMIHKPAERESVLLQAYREELVERIGRVINFDGTVQPLPGLHLYHNSVPMARVYGVVEPSLCVVAQGSKEFLLGESHYRYDPLHYLLVTVDLPNIGQVLEASKERPFLSLRLELAPTLVSSVMRAAHQAPGFPCRSRGPPAADHAGNYLPTSDGRAGWPAPSPCSSGGLYSLHRQSRQATPPRLRPASSHRAAHTRTGHERVGVASPLQSRHGDEPLAIPEAAAAAGGPASDAERRPRRGQCRLSRGVPGRLPLQPGVQKPLRCPPDARRAPAAGSS